MTTLLLIGASAVFAATPKAASVSPVGGVFPQIADGGGWKTTITLVNMDQADAPYTLSFYGEDGKPMKLDIIGIGQGFQVQGTLNVRTSKVLETVGTTGTVNVGWALLDTFSFIGGQAVFRQRVNGRPDFEAVVPIGDEFDDKFVLAFDNAGNTTSMAIVNPSSYSKTTVRCS